MIPDETIERVRESADIVGIIGEYVELKRQGTDFRGPCPVPPGHAPQLLRVAEEADVLLLRVRRERRRLHVPQKRLGRRLADGGAHGGARSRASRWWRRSRAAAPRRRTMREPFWEVNGAAAEYFRRTLWEDELGRDGARVPGAARRRRASCADTRRARLRAARDRADARVPQHARLRRRSGCSRRACSSRREDATEPRPRFRDRLMFPIYDRGRARRRASADGCSGRASRSTSTPPSRRSSARASCSTV